MRSSIAFYPGLSDNIQMKMTILCVDDETSNLDSLERCLRRDYKILTATSGAAALEIMEQNTVHLIISDQQMPEMNGVEFLTRALTIQPHAIRILLTGFANLESVIEAINKGQVYRYMTKPWDPKDLANTVEQALDLFKLRKTVADQNAQLTKANAELRSLDTMKTDFMLLVNHELKTPLTAITSYTQLLSEENLAPDHKLYLGKIEKNTQRLQNLIEDTLLITKLQASDSELILNAMNLKEELSDLWTHFQSHYPKKKLDLELSPEGTFVQQGNKKFIKIIFGKIVRNCYQHSPDEAKVSFAFSETDTHWILTSANPLDKPIEKSPEELLNAFSKNQNILNHTGGSGLGLAVIQSVAKLFQGTVKIEHDNEKFQLQLSFKKVPG